jgi:hypothetical protein
MLIQATPTILVGEHEISAGKVRAVEKLSKRDLAGILPMGFDPNPGTDRGERACAGDQSGQILCERICGGIYQAELLAIARAEHPGVTWLPGTGPASAPLLIGVFSGRVVAVVAPVDPALDLGPDSSGFPPREMCGGSGKPANPNVIANHAAPLPAPAMTPVEIAVGIQRSTLSVDEERAIDRIRNSRPRSPAFINPREAVFFYRAAIEAELFCARLPRQDVNDSFGRIVGACDLLTVNQLVGTCSDIIGEVAVAIAAELRLARVRSSLQRSWQ